MLHFLAEVLHPAVKSIWLIEKYEMGDSNIRGQEVMKGFIQQRIPDLVAELGTMSIHYIALSI